MGVGETGQIIGETGVGEMGLRAGGLRLKATVQTVYGKGKYKDDSV